MASLLRQLVLLCVGEPGPDPGPQPTLDNEPPASPADVPVIDAPPADPAQTAGQDQSKPMNVEFL